MKQKVLFSGMALASVFLLAACSTDTELSGNSWEGASGLSIDPNQTWITSVDLKLNINANEGSTVTAYTIGDSVPVVLAKKDMMGGGVMNIDVPQGIGGSIGVECFDGSTTEYRRIYLTGERSQVEDVNFLSASNAPMAKAKLAAGRAASHNPELYGNSISGQSGYSSFGGWAWENLASAIPEAQNVGRNPEINHDYEIESFGPMYVSFLYGYTGNYGKRTLGYYYHSKDDFSDIVFVDMTEALYYDYLNG